MSTTLKLAYHFSRESVFLGPESAVEYIQADLAMKPTKNLKEIIKKIEEYFSDWDGRGKIQIDWLSPNVDPTDKRKGFEKWASKKELETLENRKYKFEAGNIELMTEK